MSLTNYAYLRSYYYACAVDAALYALTICLEDILESCLFCRELQLCLIYL
jgi:hypothetical protein